MTRKFKVLDYKKLYKEVFATEAGKIVLHDLCNKFYMFSPVYMADGKEVFREGSRNVVLHILKQVHADLNKLQEERANYKLEVTND